MILDKKEKQPAEIKDYPIDYRDWLADANDTIVDAEASVSCLTTPLDAELRIHNIAISTTGVSVWLSGGTDGQKYKVTVNVTTAGGRLDQSEFIVKVKNY